MNEKGMNINPKFIIENKILTPSEYTQIQQVGIDISISKDVDLKHLEFESVYVNEKVKIPKDLFALVWSRSTFNRNGIIVRGCVLDPGYDGVPCFSIYNMSGKKLHLAKGTRICQILFFNADSAGIYKGQYQYEKLGKGDKK